jgi:uncharacterized protein YdeI (YjbR/CyaY-like superfamily)
MNKALAVDGYIRKHKPWSDALQALRQIILDAGLTEDVKWRTPCYTFAGKNVLFIGAMKSCCSISFLKGVLLKDPRNILQVPGPNTQTVRLIRFTSVDDVRKLTRILTAYMHEAIEIEKSGVKPTVKKPEEHAVPPEFQAALDQRPALKKAFESLTPGRRRAYLMHFAAAKQPKTRTARVEKWTPHILAGKGIDD